MSTMKPRMLRTFVALPLSSEMIAALADVQRRLQALAPPGSVRWVKPKSIHLTLFFLGDTPVGQVEEIRHALGAVGRHVAPFSYAVTGVGVFPNANRPRVIWVGLEDRGGMLAMLQSLVSEVLSKVGFKPESRPFVPHLTLGRVRRRVPKEDLRALGQTVRQLDVGMLGEERAERIVFFQSQLKPTGAEYTPLATIPLRG